jgi:hypothetical protein
LAAHRLRRVDLVNACSDLLFSLLTVLILRVVSLQTAPVLAEVIQQISLVPVTPQTVNDKIVRLVVIILVSEAA